jgi:hypothetical protein
VTSIFSISKKYKIAAVILITILSIISIGCAGEPKYTYEEYKKIKSIDTGKESESISENELEESSSDQEELQSYYDDLNDYNSYMNEFKSIYDKYTNELLALFDSFDNEQQDLDKKNQYANSIIDYEEKWIADLNELETPDLLKQYSDLFIDFLDNEILYYSYFLEADLANADISAQEASDSYNKSLTELEAVKESFNDRSEKLDLDPPF